jgi:hypothetical protein
MAAGGSTAGPGEKHEPFGQWALYWGVAVSAAAAPGMALLFAPITNMSYRSDLIVRWSALNRFFPVAHRVFTVMIGLAAVGLILAMLGVRAQRARAARDPGRTTRLPIGSTGDAFFGLLLGLLNLLFWGTALALSLQLAAVYQAWGLSQGLR